ncbi:MAG: hypothetical protein H6888_03560 [Nitratireductor sp.]|nr:hypothetical protein [Nitratireductor sp.]
MTTLSISQPSTLTSGDSYDGLGGTDTVLLAGGGLFDFTNTTFTGGLRYPDRWLEHGPRLLGFGSIEADREGIAGLISSGWRN